MDIMAEKKKEKMSTWDYVWDKIASLFIWGAPACGLLGAGYAVYSGWGILGAIVGFFGGFFAVCSLAAFLIFTPFVLVNGWTSVFGKSESNSDPNRQRRLERWAWLTGKPY